MTFLALSPLQTLLLALCTAGAVIALYFLKLRHRKVFVSSSLLWGRVLDDRESSSLWEKLRRIISIAIAVTIALLIALALARPEIASLTGGNERISIVLDTSPTMAARTSDGRTRWENAVGEALAILDTGGPATQFRVVDTSGSIGSAFTTDRSEIRRLIEGLTPRATTLRFPKVDQDASDVYFITDGVAVDDVPASAKRISVFESAHNAGITAFEIRSMPSTPLGYQAYLEVQNYGSAPAGVALTISSAGGQRIVRRLNLARGEAFMEVFDLSRFDGGAVRAAIQSDNDALPLDDVAFAYLPVKRKTRTLLVTRGNTYLEKLLSLDTYVELAITNPDNYRESADIDAYVFDRFAPPAPPAKPALIIGAPEVSWLRSRQGVVQKPAITSWQEDHPLMRFVSVHDLAIERAARIDPEGLTVVASSDDLPLIVASESPKWVMLTFDLESSDFPLLVGFPIFVENALAWFSRESLALQRTPGDVVVPLTNARIQDPDGNIVAARQELDQTAFQAFEPALFMASAGDAVLPVAVNLASRTFSDINRSELEGGSALPAGRTFLRHELWFYMLLAAIALISVEWFTYHRRITL
jgi:hypothetical protein